MNPSAIIMRLFNGHARHIFLVFLNALPYINDELPGITIMWARTFEN